MSRTIYRPLLAVAVLLALCAPVSEALPVSFYTSSSLLSSGKWVKVKVSTTGMQEITDEQLRSMGFADPSKVAVYGYSGAELYNWEITEDVPDDLPAVPSARYGDKLVFYGVASDYPSVYRLNSSSPVRYRVKLTRNLYDDCSYYFLTDSRPRLEVEKQDAVPAEGIDVVDHAYGVVWHNYDDQKPCECGAYLFSESFAESGVLELPLSMPGYTDAGYGTATFSYAVGSKVKSGSIRVSAPGVSGVSNTLNNYTQASDAGYLEYYYNAFVVDLANMAKATDDIYNIKVDGSSAQDRVTMGLDYYAVVYPRSTDMADLTQQPLAFPALSKGAQVCLSGAGEGVKVWEVGQATPVEMVVSSVSPDGTPGFVSPRNVEATVGSPAMQVIVFDPSAQLNTVEVVEEVRNQNFHGMDVPEMLVVASEVTLPYAERLAAIHREKTGVDAAVVLYSDVCNEFASGVSHPMAIRRMAKMLYDRDPSRFKAVLIFARAFHDNTGHASTETREAFDRTYIPMLQCDEISYCGDLPRSYATDAIYGMLEDDFVYDNVMSAGHFLRAPLSIRVGRIPAVNAAEAMDYLSKMEKYLSTPPNKPLYNRVVITADRGDGNLHFGEATEVRDLINTLSPSTVTDMHLLSVYSSSSNDKIRKRMGELFQRGVGMWFFLGHSSSYSNIGGGTLWNIMYDKNLLNDNPPFVVFGTCTILGLDKVAPSLQTAMLFNTTGGMIAGVGAPRPTYAEWNHYPCLMMSRGYYTQKAGATFGDVFRDGRNLFAYTPEVIASGIGSSPTAGINIMNYNFAGDPMLPMHLPDGSVKITSWNSEPVPAAVEVSPLVAQKIEGEVYNSDGDVDTSFNGLLTMLVYDGKHTANSSVNVNGNNPLVEIDLDESVLQEVTFDVVDGRFSGDVSFAIPTYAGGGNRVTLYAVSGDSRHSAVGWLDGLTIDQEADLELSDAAAAPEITALYAAGEDVEENDCLPGNFMLYAEVAPSDVALLGVSDRFGGGLSLTIDNSKKVKGIDGYFSVNTDGSASLACPVSDLTDGPHVLTFRVVNVAGKSAERSIAVNVVNVAEAVTVVEQLHARDEAVIDIRHNLTDAPVGRLVVESADGNVVFTDDNAVFPYSWNLSDNGGNPVADGVYSAKVYFKAGRHYGFSAPALIVVGR